MKKRVFTITAATLLLTALFVQSCKDKTSTTTTPTTTTPSEFVADDNTFKGFESWTLTATKNGVDPAMLKTAHAGDDSTSVRKIYFGNSAVTRENGEFPVGTIVSKITTWQGNGGGSMITAMAKRGNNFDAGGNNWEYFVLNADGSILVDNGTTMRGANLMNGACKGCHAAASATDYIFTK